MTMLVIAAPLLAVGALLTLMDRVEARLSTADAGSERHRPVATTRAEAARPATPAPVAARVLSAAPTLLVSAVAVAVVAASVVIRTAA